MKLIKLILIFVMFYTVGFAQEVNDAIADKVKLKEETKIVVEKKTTKESALTDSKNNNNTVKKISGKSDLGKESLSSAKKIKSTLSKAESVKKSVKDKKNNVVKKNISAKNKAKISTESLLEIDDGDFKYQRISGIILTDKKAIPDESVDNSVAASKIEIDTEELSGKSSSEDEKSLFDFGKNLSDIIARGGILLLIIIIFLLYRRRNKGTVKKGSKRNVLNSYRK